MKFSVTENGSHAQNTNLESWKYTADGRDLFVPEQNLARGGWSCWGNISFCFLGKLCEIFFLTWNPVAKKIVSKTDFTAHEGEVSDHRLRQDPWIFLCQNNVSPGPSLVLLLLFFKLQPLALPDISCSAFQQVCIMFSNHPLTVSRSLAHLLPSSAVAIPLWDPPLPRLPTKVSHRRSELPLVTAPMEMIREPFQTTFPIPAQVTGNSSLPTFGQFAWYEADEASQTLSLTFRAAIF